MMLESLRSIRHQFINCFERKKLIYVLLRHQMCVLTGCGTRDPSAPAFGWRDISLLGKATLAAKAAQQPIY